MPSSSPPLRPTADIERDFTQVKALDGEIAGKASLDQVGTTSISSPFALAFAPKPIPSDGASDEDARSAGDIIDLDTFHQILDLDEDETHDFSAGMAWAYFDQAGSTFTKMENALKNENLAELSSLGHFLKGSSAALGVAKVQASCERMQHYGQQRDEEAGTQLTEGDALERIRKLLEQVKDEYGDAEEWLRNWYKEHGVEQDG